MRPASKEAYQLMHDGAIALTQIEHNGFRVSEAYLQSAIDDITAREAELTAALKADPIWKTWKAAFKGDAKLSSRTQLGEVIFGRLGHECRYKTPTGLYAAGEEAFDHLDIPFVRSYLELANLQKTRDTFLKGILSESVNGYVRPSFMLNSVITYRSSCRDPNLQNVPARNQQMSAYVRKAFVARDGRRIVETDFSGVEVRVAACYTKDPVLIRYIEDPTTDMHRDTAMDMFLLTKEQVEETRKKTRDCAKNMFVFPQFYGSVYFQCAPQIWDAMERRDFRAGKDGIPMRQHLAKKGITSLGDVNAGADTVKGTFVHLAKKVEESMWNERFRVYTDWKRRWWDDYCGKGYVHTLTGFLCQGVYRRNQVLNTAIQGSAFHCLLWSLVRLQKWLNKWKMRTKIVGQIHDSIVADVHPDEFDDYLAAVKQIITVDLRRHWDWIIVPMEIEAEASEVGGTWYDKAKVNL